jgi:hypothetical protein
MHAACMVQGGFMTDYEIDEACNFVLQKLGEMNPILSKEITKICKGAKYKKLPDRLRKIEKVRILYKKSETLFREIYAPVNKEWFNEDRSPDNFFDILDKQAKSLNLFGGEITGGNYSGKV